MSWIRRVRRATFVFAVLATSGTLAAQMEIPPCFSLCHDAAMARAQDGWDPAENNRIFLKCVDDLC